jgi:folate-dependent phosphoribosylglycinamide formyltransferase PurN
MHIAIITGSYPHHKQLCVELAKAHDVVGIFHPRMKPLGLRKNLRKASREWKQRGGVHALLRLAVKMPGMTGWNVKWSARPWQQAEQKFFGEAARAYSQLDPKLIHEIENVNSKQGIAKIGKVDADVVICLGGPIYRRALIDSCKLMLNFHSGFSPLYNGADTISFAFANGHPHLCAGTLMAMSPVVDGGDILAHYLPDLEPDDNPATINMKILRGAIDAYDRFLCHLAGGGAYVSCKQPPPLFTCRGIDWTVGNAVAASRYLRAKHAGKFARDSQLVEYWRHQSELAASEALAQTVLSALGMNPELQNEC